MKKAINKFVGLLTFFGITGGIISFVAITLLFIGNGDIEITTHGAITSEQDWPQTLVWIKIWSFVLLLCFIACLPKLLIIFLKKFE